jgi:hypothetical protein
LKHAIEESMIEKEESEECSKLIECDVDEVVS